MKSWLEDSLRALRYAEFVYPFEMSLERTKRGPSLIAHCSLHS